MTIAALVVGIVSAGYSAYSAYETKQDQKAALKKQEVLQQDQLAKKKKKILAQQKASMLASGLSLTSESYDVMKEETLVASQAEANRISDYYDTQIGVVGGQARAQYISSLGSAVRSVGNYYNNQPTANLQTGAGQTVGAN